MTFEQAKHFRIPFEPYLDWTLDEVACTDGGLVYLDRVRSQHYMAGPLKEAIDVYLEGCS